MRKINLTTAFLVTISIFSCTKEATLKTHEDSSARYEEVRSNQGQTEDEYILMEEELITSPTGDDDDEYILMDEVVDSSSTPVMGAVLTLSGHGLSVTDTTDLDGQCQLVTGKQGDYHLQVSFQGLVYVSGIISIHSDTIYRLDMLPI